MKVERLNENEARVICLDHDALFELLTETMIENSEDFFDIKDSTSVSFQMLLNRETNCFLCAILDEKDGRILDLYRIEKEIGATTSTMFTERRYDVLEVSKFIIQN